MIRVLVILFSIQSIASIALIAFLEPVEARGRRAEVMATNETEIQACRQNENGMKILARKALNRAKSSAADRVDALDWSKICQCFGPKHLALSSTFTKEVKAERGWYQNYEMQRDAIIVECSSGGPTVTSVVAPPIESAVQSPSNDAKFTSVVQDCVKVPKGYLKNAEVHMRLVASPRASRVTTMDPKKYCACYVQTLRSKIGDALALQDLTTMVAPKDEDLFRIRQAKSQTYEACVAEQISL